MIGQTKTKIIVDNSHWQINHKFFPCKFFLVIHAFDFFFSKNKREGERERESERETYICDLRLHVVIFTTIYYNIYDMRERERERGGKTSAYHNLILYYLHPHKICVRLFHFKEYKREREIEREEANVYNLI